MKKKYIIVLVSALLLTGCTKKKNDKPEESPTASPEASATSYLTLEEAESLVGFNFTLPEVPTPISTDYQVSPDKKMLIVTYAYANDEEIVAKKYKGIDTIAKVDKDFDKTEIGMQNNHEIRLSDKEGTIYVAQWHTDQFSYSLYISTGLSEQEFLAKTGVMQ